jgi:hypothetical protein
MVNTVIVIIALLICQVSTGTPNSNQIICSAFCAQQQCTGFSSGECKSCGSFGWGGSPSCDITDPKYALLDYSGDAGGSITVTSGATTTSCTTLLTYTTAYGDYKANEVVTINLLGGTYLGHYAIDLYFDFILIDVTGGQKWDNKKLLTTTLVGTTQTATKRLNSTAT